MARLPLFVPFFTSLPAYFFIYLFLPFFIFDFFVLSFCLSFYFFCTWSVMGKQNNTVKFGVPGFFDCSGVPVFPGFSTTQGSLSWLSCREIMVQIIFCCSFPRISGKSENCCDFFPKYKPFKRPPVKVKTFFWEDRWCHLLWQPALNFPANFHTEQLNDKNKD